MIRRNNHKILRNLKSLLLFFVGVFLIFSSQNIFAQEEPKPEEKIPDEKQNEQLLEIISEQSDAPFDFDTYLETLEDLKNYPLDLNSASYDEFKLLGNLITPQQINGIISYRQRMNGFSTVYELQGVQGFDLPSIQSLLPYITVIPMEERKRKTSLKRLLFDGKYQVFLRYTQILEEQRGYTIEDPTRSRYLGSPQRYYVRYRYNYGTKFSYGFTAEKDPGEEFFKGTQKQGFDFYSAHIFVRDVSVFKAIAIGDYNVRFGQGLAMWTGFGFRKTPLVMSVQKYAPAISPYTSVNEAFYMRGAAATAGFGKLDVTGFVSYKKVDASVASSVDTIDVEFLEITSLQETGLHRTPTEIRNKNATSLLTTGGSLKYRFKKATLGLNGVYNKLSAAFLASDVPYRRFNFTGSEVANVSIDYSWLIGSFTFFGEAAMNNEKGVAIVNGALINASAKAQFSLVHRYYDRKYFALQQNAFGESATGNNEAGLYAGMVLRPLKKTTVSTFFDFYRFPWIKYLIDAPSRGFEYFGQVNYAVSSRVDMHVRYRYEIRNRNVPANETKIDYLTDVVRQSLRYHVSYALNRKVAFQNRVEYAWYNDNINPVEKGFMIYQDIRLEPFKFPLTIYARYTLFDTQTFNARIYAYENDILYMFSIPPLSDNGFRYYLLLKYDINPNITVWLRFAQTYFSNREKVGSGLDEINGNTRSEIKAQVRVRF